MLRLAQCDAGCHAERQRVVRSSDDVLFPESDHDWTPVKVRAPGQLEVPRQTTADSHVNSRGPSTTRTGRSDSVRPPRGSRISSPRSPTVRATPLFPHPPAAPHPPTCPRPHLPPP